MLLGLTLFELAVVGLAALTAGGAACSLVLTRLTWPLAYPDFIAGYLAWTAGAKLQDLAALPVLVVATLGAGWLLARILRALRARQGEAAAQDFLTQLAWWSLPGLVGGAGYVLGLHDNTPLLVLSLGGVGLVGAATGLRLLLGQKADPGLAGYAGLAAVLLALLPLAAALGLGRFGLPLPGGLALFLRLAQLAGLTAAALLLLLLLLRPGYLRRGLPWLLGLGQVGAAAFYLTIWPARLLTPDGTLHSYPVGWGLAVLTGALVLAGLFDTVRRLRKYLPGSAAGWGGLLSPWAFLALLVLLRLGLTTQPVVTADDYHFGEGLLGWWLWWDHGKLPYVDFMPAHSLLYDYISAFLSQIFYDGTAATLPEGGRLAFLLLSAGAFLSLKRLTGSLGLAFAATLFMGARLAWLFLTPFVCLWLAPGIWGQPARWLILWAFTAPLAVLGVPPHAGVLVAAFIPVALSRLWRLRPSHLLATWPWLVGGAVAWGLLALFTPVVRMAEGAVRYVLENGAVNLTAYGIPWTVSWSPAFGRLDGLVFEAVRMSWLAIPLAALWVILRRPGSGEERSRAFWTALTALLFTLPLLSYTQGRLDPGNVSRAGLLAVWGWTVLIPLMLWPVASQARRALLTGVCAAGAACLGLFLPTWGGVVASLPGQVATGPLTDGRDLGLPRLGQAGLDPAHLMRLKRLEALFTRELTPEQTYLDLTGRHAQYFYLDRVPPLAVTAPYNLAAVPQQQRAVARLAADPPPLVLVGPDVIIHDHTNPSLRAHLVYRYVVENYVPAWEDGFLVAYRRGSPAAARPLRLAVSHTTSRTWRNGVAPDRAAVRLARPLPFAALTPGDGLRLADGQVRRVTSLAPDLEAVDLEGPPLDPAQVGAPGRVEVLWSAERLAGFQEALWEQAFATRDLALLPTAWGRSEASLAGRMTLVRDLAALPRTLDDLAPEGDLLRVKGPDPGVSFDLAAAPLAGSQAGLLRLDFTCPGAAAPPRLQVFWWGDGARGPAERHSLRLTAGGGTLLIPLDAFPSWLTLGRVAGLRVDLDNPGACPRFRLTGAGLWQRKSVTEAPALAAAAAPTPAVGTDSAETPVATPAATSAAAAETPAAAAPPAAPAEAAATPAPATAAAPDATPAATPGKE
ncbi:MAG: hypothetical protein KQJ78_11725 [Deltaproteobacteria bacterium]|nr:hypothetical protein [Deltaproteobacteria bacterium]